MRKKLLLADDSPTIQRVIELTFADEPVDVIAVSDGATAIERLDAEPPDIVLADIGMPGQDGYAVALHVRQTPALAHVPVVLLTGAFDPVDHGLVRRAGCAGVLVKPFDPHMLVSYVRTLLDRPTGSARADVTPEPEEAVAAAAPTSAGAATGSNEPVPPPESRALVVDRYFEQLDRAFASLNPRVEDAPVIAAAAPAAPAAVPGVHVVPDGVSAPPGGAPAPAPPTLGDAFGALLALEQGQPLPEGADRFASLFTPAAIERIATRVSREVSARVVRELAPEIVSELAERLVREQIERLKASPTER